MTATLDELVEQFMGGMTMMEIRTANPLRPQTEIEGALWRRMRNLEKGLQSVASKTEDRKSASKAKKVLKHKLGM